jgi:hypothetical protein
VVGRRNKDKLSTCYLCLDVERCGNFTRSRNLFPAFALFPDLPQNVRQGINLRGKDRHTRFDKKIQIFESNFIDSLWGRILRNFADN